MILVPPCESTTNNFVFGPEAVENLPTTKLFNPNIPSQPVGINNLVIGTGVLSNAKSFAHNSWTGGMGASGYTLSPTHVISNCTVVGTQALENHQAWGDQFSPNEYSSRNMTVIGSGALRNANGVSDVVSVGVDSLRNVRNSGAIVNIGDRSLLNANNTSYVVNIGSESMENINVGSSIVSVGHNNISKINSSNNLIVVGNFIMNEAGRIGHTISIGNGSLNAINQEYGGSVTSTVAIGHSSANDIRRANSCVILGEAAGRVSPPGELVIGVLQNCILIGANSRPSSSNTENEITLGDAAITTFRCATQTITSLSDVRDKKDINTLQAGLDFVSKLKPVSFNWNMRDGGKVDISDTGFIAQDLQQVQTETGVIIPGLVSDVNPEKLEASYGKLIPILVKAIQDLQAEVEQLKSQK